MKKSISRGSNPILSLITKSMVEVDYPCEEYYMPSLPKMEKPKIEGMSISNFVVSLFRVNVKIGKLNVCTFLLNSSCWWNSLCDSVYIVLLCICMHA